MRKRTGYVDFQHLYICAFRYARHFAVFSASLRVVTSGVVLRRMSAYPENILANTVHLCVQW